MEGLIVVHGALDLVDDGADGVLDGDDRGMTLEMVAVDNTVDGVDGVLDEDDLVEICHW